MAFHSVVGMLTKAGSITETVIIAFVNKFQNFVLVSTDILSTINQHFFKWKA